MVINLSFSWYLRIKRSSHSTNKRHFGTIQNMENHLFEDMPTQEDFDFRIELLSIDAIQRKARISFIDQCSGPSHSMLWAYYLHF